jgi:hypothetical protein
VRQRIRRGNLEQGYAGPPEYAGEYLEARGRRSARTSLLELLAATGLPHPAQADGAMSFGDDYYRTSHET